MKKKARNNTGDSELANVNEIESLLVGNALIDRSVGDNNGGMGDEEVKFGDKTIAESEGSYHQRKGSKSDDFTFFAQHGDDITHKSAASVMGWSNYRGEIHFSVVQTFMPSISPDTSLVVNLFFLQALELLLKGVINRH